MKGANGMKIYTRTGDKGQTGIIGGRVDKDHIRVDAYGTVDEANGFVGQAVTQLQPGLFRDVLEDLEKIQHELFDCGGDLANVTKKHTPKLTEEAIVYLENRIDALYCGSTSIRTVYFTRGKSCSSNASYCTNGHKKS